MERTLDLQFLTAEERYQKLTKQYPQILQRTTLGEIASFLNITQEHLSRIRAAK
jgi:CRP-like cAMP-binding protein